MSWNNVVFGLFSLLHCTQTDDCFVLNDFVHHIDLLLMPVLGEEASFHERDFTVLIVSFLLDALALEQILIHHNGKKDRHRNIAVWDLQRTSCL